jgi:exo-beta-1,3-glucanase (GH17 family)
MADNTAMSHTARFGIVSIVPSFLVGNEALPRVDLPTSVLPQGISRFNTELQL